MNKKLTSIVVGKPFKDQEGKTVMEKIVIHEIKFIKDIIKSDSKFILKGKKGAVVIGAKSRETKTERSKVQGINLLTGEPLYLGGKK